MANVKDTFNKLKQNIVGTKTSKIDSELDSAIQSISLYRSRSNSNGYVELIRNLISKQGYGDISQNSGLFSHGDSSPASFGQGRRLQRYKTYESIVSNISYCKRALDVLVGNILSPDDITKSSLEIRPNSYLEDSSENQNTVKNIQEIISRMKIEENLQTIVTNTLKFGDFFVEIADSKTALTSKSILSEHRFFTNMNQANFDSREVIYNDDQFKVTISYSAFQESKDSDNESKDKDKDKDNDSIPLSNLNLVFHSPDRVVKLQSEMFPICFGYLVFPKYPKSSQYGMHQDEAVNNICTNILKNLEKSVPQASELNNDDELKDIISTMIRKTDQHQTMNIRFVPPDKVTHFMIPSSKYYPYGESIFDVSQFDAKVLMSLITALAIQRINRSTEKRKIGVELGLPRDAAKQVENLKEEFRKRKVNLDSFGTVDTIPCLALDTEIRMLNGFSMKLEDIINEVNNGNNELWVYSYDFNTGKVFPNRIKNAKVTGRNVNVVRVNLDNDESVVCTPEHRWLLRDGTYKEAKDLEKNDSLMPHEEGNYKVESIEFLDKKIDVGDIEVDEQHNFALNSGVFIHNSSISTFEDIYIPQKDGKPFVEIESMDQGKVDIRSKIEELEFLRNSIVASLGVPNAFINLENELCLDAETCIPMLDGSSMPLYKIIEEYKNGNYEMYTYSYDHNSGEIVPGKITWADYTRLNAQLVRVHLDNGNYIDCTPDHKFMLRDGTYKEAQYLEDNQALMPLYKKYTKGKAIRSSEFEEGCPYELVYHPNKRLERWQLTYHLVDEYFNGKKERGYVVHHNDYDPRNNHPNNLTRMPNFKHVTIHGKDLVKWAPGYKGKVYVDRECDICGEKFVVPYNNSRRTCSKECNTELRRIGGYNSWEIRKELHDFKHFDLYCFICGEKITNKFQYLQDKSYKNVIDQIRSCDNEFCKRHIRQISNLTNKGKKLYCEIEYDHCSICGNLYINCSEKTEKKKLKMPEVCSLRCMNIVLNKRSSESKKRKTNVFRTCPICHEEFMVPQWYAKSVKNPKCEDCKKSINSENTEKDVALNHKVVTVEWLEGSYDTGDIRIENYHNFAVEAGVIVHNSNKSALSEENLLFARTIVNHQKYLNPQLISLIEKILSLHNPDLALTFQENVSISFPSPRSLQYERESRYIGDLVNLIESLERIGVPKDYTKKKYLSQIDWDEVENWESHQAIEDNIGGDDEEEGGEEGFGGL